MCKWRPLPCLFLETGLRGLVRGEDWRGRCERCLWSSGSSLYSRYASAPWR